MEYNQMADHASDIEALASWLYQEASPQLRKKLRGLIRKTMIAATEFYRGDSILPDGRIGVDPEDDFDEGIIEIIGRFAAKWDDMEYNDI
jgi:hypothetical protein